MLEKVKIALRIKTAALDGEITDNINAAIADLGLVGVINTEQTDPLIIRAVVTFCKMNMGNPAEYEKLKSSYDEQKAQLQSATGYTNWGDIE